MSIPADFRRVLEAGDPNWQSGQPVQAQIIYGAHLHERIQVYSIAEFRKIVARIQSMPDDDPNKEPVTEILITQSEPLTIDKDGRTVLGIRHRKKLDVDEGLLSFGGKITHFDIRKSENYEAEVATPVKDYLSDKPKNFNPLSVVP